MAALFAELTQAEGDQLWWKIARAMVAVTDEIDALERAPAALRDELYGAHCLESYQGIRGELAELAEFYVPHHPASWTPLVAADPERGNTQWHDSEGTPRTHRRPKSPRWTRQSPVSCPGPSPTTRLRSFLRKCSPRSWTP